MALTPLLCESGVTFLNVTVAMPLTKPDLTESFCPRDSLKGYQAGFGGKECPSNASRFYRIGWRNGRMDLEALTNLQTGAAPR